MSELGEISRELRDVLDRLDRVLQQFATLDRSRLAPLEAELRGSPRQRQAAALVARARAGVRRAADGAAAARRASELWLSIHGSEDAGGSRG